MRVVAIHGYPLDHRLFTPLAKLATLGQLGPGVSVFAPDLRGRRGSHFPAQSIHPMSLFADDLAGELEGRLGKEERFVVLGLSMGGYVALEFIARHRARFGKRLAALCLCGSRAGSDDEAGRRNRELGAQALERVGIEAALSAMLPRLLPPERRGGAIESVTRQMILDTPAATAAADLRGMATRNDHFQTVATIDFPILLVAGDSDTIVPVSEFEAIAETATLAPYIRLFTLPGVGHLAPLEAPEEVAGALKELIEKAS